VTQCEAIIEAFQALGRERRISEIEDWVSRKYGRKWKDFGTLMADMVPIKLDGNTSSSVSPKYRRLKRVRRGYYSLIEGKRPKLREKILTKDKTEKKIEKILKKKILLKNEYWIPSNPVTFATRGEKPWKKILEDNLPASSRMGKNERGLTLDFSLTDLAPDGHPLDLDNLCEPVFSIIVNRKGWFNGSRQNILWFKAKKTQSQKSGLLIKFHQEVVPNKIIENLIFNEYYSGPLPTSATSPELPAWINSKYKKREDIENIILHLKFDDPRLNLGDIATGKVKATIDCLYPIIGGYQGAPEDHKISEFQIEKSQRRSNRRGVHIKIARI